MIRFNLIHIPWAVKHYIQGDASYREYYLFGIRIASIDVTLEYFVKMKGVSK